MNKHDSQFTLHKATVRLLTYQSSLLPLFVVFTPLPSTLPSFTSVHHTQHMLFPPFIFVLSHPVYGTVFSLDKFVHFLLKFQYSCNRSSTLAPLVDISCCFFHMSNCCYYLHAMTNFMYCFLENCLVGTGFK